MTKHCGFAVVCVLLIGLASPCQSAPLIWTLDNVSFGECYYGLAPCAPGGFAQGYFVYDASTNVVSEWNVSVSGGDLTVFPAYTYSDSIVGHVVIVGSAGRFVSIEGTDKGAYVNPRELRLFPQGGTLPDAVTTVPLDPGNIFQAECYDCDPYRIVASGQLISSAPPIPEPASLFLLGTGLVALRVRRGPR